LRNATLLISTLSIDAEEKKVFNPNNMNSWISSQPNTKEKTIKKFK